MKPDLTTQYLRLVAFFMCLLLLTIAVVKYEGAAIAFVAGALALIAQLLGFLPDPGGVL